MSADEVKKWINGLAELYLKEGVKPGQISRKIAESTGYSHGYIMALLENKYKDAERIKAGKMRIDLRQSEVLRPNRDIHYL